MPASVVPIGSVVFALIDPMPGHELAFNDWYERDHFYRAGMAAPGVFSGARFIATRACKDLRDPGHGGGTADPARGSHLALYFVLPGRDDARIAFATEQMAEAAAEGRLFAEREHLHTWSYTLAWTWRADPGGVPPALALDHRYPSVSVLLVDHPDPDVALAAAVETAGPAVRDAIDLVVALRPDYEVMPSTWIGDIDSSTRRALVCFHPVGVEQGWRATRVLLAGLADADVGAGPAEVVWASPFVAAVVGTDRHVDDL